MTHFPTREAWFVISRLNTSLRKSTVAPAESPLAGKIDSVTICASNTQSWAMQSARSAMSANCEGTSLHLERNRLESIGALLLISFGGRGYSSWCMCMHVWNIMREWLVFKHQYQWILGHFFSSLVSTAIVENTSLFRDYLHDILYKKDHSIY